MKIRDIFLLEIERMFSIAEDAVHVGTYTVEVDDGFSEPEDDLTDSVRCIFESFKAKEDVDNTFSELIQPLDVMGLMPFVDLVNCDISTKAYVEFDSGKYMVEAYTVDPLNVIYTLLLRKV